MSVSAINERLAALTAAGTSVWLDQLRRGMIASGELARMVEEDSLRGVTSNPAIFEKAILGSSDYDEGLIELVRENLSADELYRRIAVDDVRDACDVLRGVYDETGGVDGYVSLEVAPSLAHDTEGTIAEARSFWQLVDRPNLMIKVPGTDAGIPAVEQLLYEGLNVNVTLLFSVSRYEKVMEAFITAMERRQAENLPLDRHSVASFFVSRVDSEVDKRLESMGNTELLGIAGLANARAAYQAFKRVFGGERFATLAEAGCPVQRPLWASTGVKNPAYPQTMYVYELVAPSTVNTMPLNTLVAAGQEGEIRGATADQDPADDLRRLGDAGIDLDDVTEKLLLDGIEAFAKPMDKLIDGIERKREAIVTGRPGGIDADLPADFEKFVADRVAKAVDEEVVRRIWHRDGTLWAPEGTPELTDRLGWLSIVETMLGEVDDLRQFVSEVRGDGITDVVVLGMGGSSLAPEVFRQSAGRSGDGLRLHVLDSTHPRQVRAVAESIDPTRTLFLLSTKSGGTIETLSLFKHFHAIQGDGSHWAAISDPGSSLLDLAEQHSFRRAFVNDPEIGGRYSALSFFGLVPAALVGIDVGGVLDSARVGGETCGESSSADANTGLWLGCALGELALQGCDKLTFVVDEPLGSFGLWAEQLIAESTGKHGQGILPIADEPLADPQAYGKDRVFLHLRNTESPDEAADAALVELAKAGHAVLVLHYEGAIDLGRLFFVSEFATAVAGWALGINPFDQPNVQEAKDNTRRVLDQGPAESEDGSALTLLGGLQSPSYLAILGYLPYSDEVSAAIARLRGAVVAQRGVATTFGYGPRYLHSTGQLHKGGPASGAFLLLTDDSDEDAEIPGEGYGFRRLIEAQAAGDLETLRAHGLDAVRLRLPAGDLAAAIDQLAKDA
ncbi:MAG: bifunctional transaldolase/phosoglucose isomerase [Solirubrobacterales bacterium]|nr:bifunctional transaldolase/phosoglucose isomerase [Solirubrobacterales bacterium]